MFGFALGSLLVVAACGNSSKNSGSMSGGSTAGIGGGGKVSAVSCYKQCEAQAAVQGCTAPVSVSECKALCDGLVSTTPASCATQFDAYYNCSANDGFMCLGDLLAQKTNACMSAQDTLDRCRNGGSKTTCKGALPSGVCPSVQCPCKSGTKPVSGFDQSGGKCRCYDTTTCQDLFCD
jgi:hypothetical protein